MFKQVMVPRLFSEVHKEVQPAQHQPNHHQTSTFPGSMPMAGMDFQGWRSNVTIISNNSFFEIFENNLNFKEN